MVRFASSYFFFFQAEDGIRDLTVTGVQTCALPIYPTPGSLLALPSLPPRTTLAWGSYAPAPKVLREGHRAFSACSFRQSSRQRPSGRAAVQEPSALLACLWLVERAAKAGTLARFWRSKAR